MYQNLSIGNLKFQEMLRVKIGNVTKFEANKRQNLGELEIQSAKTWGRQKFKAQKFRSVRNLNRQNLEVLEIQSGKKFKALKIYNLKEFKAPKFTKDLEI